MRTTDPQDRPIDLTGEKTKPAPPPPPARQVSPGVFEVNGKFETRNPDYPMAKPVLPKLPHWGGWELLLGGEGAGD